MLLQAVKELFEVLQGGTAPAGYQSVIHKVEASSISLCHPVHLSLECCTRVVLSQRHPLFLKDAEWYGDCHLGNVGRMVQYLVTSLPQVYLGADCGSGHLDREVQHVGEEVQIWLIDRIQAAKVTHGC
jgi:hypothetical protein